MMCGQSVFDLRTRCNRHSHGAGVEEIPGPCSQGNWLGSKSRLDKRNHSYQHLRLVR